MRNAEAPAPKGDVQVVDKEKPFQEQTRQAAGRRDDAGLDNENAPREVDSTSCSALKRETSDEANEPTQKDSEEKEAA
jgi:hypothetical protein